ncbi:MAG: hypothetical protein ACI4EO_09080 [Blautia sp.]
MTQRKKIKENPYDYNPVEEKITAVFDWMSGNRNSISVSDDMKNMKYLSERIAKNLLQQMKRGEELGLPEDIVTDKFCRFCGTPAMNSQHSGVKKEPEKNMGW